MHLEGELGICKMMSKFRSTIKNNDPATENGKGTTKRLQLFIFWGKEKGLIMIIRVYNGI